MFDILDKEPAIITKATNTVTAMAIRPPCPGWALRDCAIGLEGEVSCDDLFGDDLWGFSKYFKASKCFNGLILRIRSVFFFNYIMMEFIKLKIISSFSPSIVDSKMKLNPL
jgi:hypothetical protein